MDHPLVKSGVVFLNHPFLRNPKVVANNINRIPISPPAMPGKIVFLAKGL